MQKALADLEPARAVAPPAVQKRIDSALDFYLQRIQTRRIYVTLDKPLYQPGETIWFRTWEMATRDLGLRPRRPEDTVVVSVIGPANETDPTDGSRRMVAQHIVTTPRGGSR